MFAASVCPGYTTRTLRSSATSFIRVPAAKSSGDCVQPMQHHNEARPAVQRGSRSARRAVCGRIPASLANVPARNWAPFGTATDPAAPPALRRTRSRKFTLPRSGLRPMTSALTGATRSAIPSIVDAARCRFSGSRLRHFHLAAQHTLYGSGRFHQAALSP